MAFAPVADDSVVTTNGNYVVATAGVDTTGADLIIVGVTYESGTVSISDNKGNTYTQRQTRTNSIDSIRRVDLWECTAPTVGSGHTITLTASDAAALVMHAYSGASSPPSHDQSTNEQGSFSNIYTYPSITPTEDGELLVAVLASSCTSACSIDSGFTVQDQIAEVTGHNNSGIAFADFVQTTAAAIAPTWTADNSLSAAVLVSFKPGAGGGGGDTFFASRINFI